MRSFLSSLFYKPKHGKVSEKTLITRLTMNILIMVLCMAGMMFSAYAYFACSITSGINVLQAAYFDAEVKVEAMDPVSTVELQQETTEADPTVLPNSDGSYSLSAGLYRVTITRTGTGLATTGFFVVTVDQEVYHTQQLDLANVSVQFVLDLQADAKVTFQPCWGTSSKYEAYLSDGEDDGYIQNAEVVVPPVQVNEEEPTEPDEYVYIVQAGDTLQEIANRFGVELKDICQRNEIENANLIVVGQQVIIPGVPADATIPEATEEEPGEPETTEAPETTVEPETTAAPETTAEPETTAPETTIPETTVPETTVPEATEVPETGEPESVPETSEPETVETTGSDVADPTE